MPDVQYEPVDHDPFAPSGGEAELRAYQPTWRDRMAAFLLSDHPSSHVQRMARELLGSSGIGTSGPSAIDLVPGVGPALHAQEAIQHGDIPEAAGQVAAAAVPGGALASKVLMPAARPLVRGAITAGTGAVAGTAAALGLSGDEAAAAPRGIETLTPAEREVYRRLGPDDRAKFWTNKAAADAKTQGEEAAKNADAIRVQKAKEAEAEIARQDAQAAADLQRKNDEAANAARIAEEQRVAGLPFRQRYPIPAAAIQATFTAGAGAIPFALGRASNIAANADTKAWGLLADRAKKAIEGGNLNKARITTNELTARLDAMEAGQRLNSGSVLGKIGKATALANSAMMPFEGGTVIPNAWDYYSHPPGTPAHDQAAEELTSRLPFNFGVGLAEGIPPALLASKLAGARWPLTAPPVARSRSLVQSYEQAFPEDARLGLGPPEPPRATRKRTSKPKASKPAPEE